MDHWRRGHKQICKKIHRGGNAEQYHADKKYKEAVAVAVEACRGRHEGQKCYICLEAVHPHTGEGLVRGCACGDRDGVSSPELGVAHVSCLARQAKILCDEGEETDLDGEAFDKRWMRWEECGLCEQRYHGFVWCALGWACWKTYVGRPETDWARVNALTVLGNGLWAAERHAERLAIVEVQLATQRRLGISEYPIIVTRSNFANCLHSLGRLDEALAMERDVYARCKELLGTTNKSTLHTGNNLAHSLIQQGQYAEAKEFAGKLIPQCRRALGSNHVMTLNCHAAFAEALYSDAGASRADVLEAVTILEDVVRARRRVFGNHHPETIRALAILEGARMKREDVAA